MGDLHTTQVHFRHRRTAGARVRCFTLPTLQLRATVTGALVRKTVGPTINGRRGKHSVFLRGLNTWRVLLSNEGMRVSNTALHYIKPQAPMTTMSRFVRPLPFPPTIKHCLTEDVSSQEEMNGVESFIKSFKVKNDEDLAEDAVSNETKKYYYNPDGDQRDKGYQGSNVFIGFENDPVVQDADGTTLRTGESIQVCKVITSHITHSKCMQALRTLDCCVTYYALRAPRMALLLTSLWGQEVL